MGLGQVSVGDTAAKIQKRPIPGAAGLHRLSQNILAKKAWRMYILRFEYSWPSLLLFRIFF
jgi:hypothetical protein